MQQLKEKIKKLPDQPGVYQYFDAQGRLLYIGKAKSLKKRVKSYFRFTPFTPAPNLSPRIYKMVSEIKNLEYIVVSSENDALILENSLIKQLKPKYNILLRDDKTYPYIYVDFAQEFPRLKITRKVLAGKKVKYFGPFPSAAKDIVNSIYEIFPLVQKESCIKGKKACLFYQMQKCLAPCEGKISKEKYRKILDEAIAHIHNKKLLLQKLEQKMLALSAQLRFEEAAQIRDRIDKIRAIEIQSEIDFAKLQDIDVYAIASDKTQAAIVRMFMREGKVVASSSNIVRIDEYKGFDKEEAYKRVLLEFYTTQTPLTASLIVVAEEFEAREELENFLSQKFNKKITITHPKRGEKRRLADIAQLNAKEILAKSKPKSDIEEQLQNLLDLNSKPYRIEVFDNSHISGSVPVGAMIVYENGAFDKKSYRHYNLHTQDEYAQMKELLTHRCESFAKNPPPDMWLIDGGETLRRLAQDIAQSFGVSIDVIAIAKEKIDAKAHRAKGEAKDIIYTQNGVLRLLPTDKRLQFLQKLRDEAHRFATTFHRKQRSKKAKELELLKISGIGEAKIRKLLNYFGSFENIRLASEEELSDVLNKKDAKNIKKSLN
ncbi:excinuclease ABC subunit C [Nitratiruptor sp. YY08-26]|uniref:excinuclease ABC subunit UvrC n=1 Tax=unclassified Nitratiruptor TaxID=2624044 RepID=UPI0019165A05|nr:MULTISPECIES: excinuclease ABC subunit UvrC [unclassified Nitratiruptor]BCD62668.1 excinuclease ABC subunit C [Nitratiruptor sp. YY08-13]BCD66604.1 excinuclease ABC subunit C [Nitratiruptor sp. YY08-26]